MSYGIRCADIRTVTLEMIMDNPADVGPFVIDPTGRDILGEAERIRALGPVAQVEMPAGVRAWAVTDQVLLRRLLTDSRVSKDAYQHWPAPGVPQPGALHRCPAG